MASATPARTRTSTGELAEVAIDGTAADSQKAGKQGAAGGRRPSIQLTAQAGGGHAAQPDSQAALPAGRDRVDSGGLDYPADSRNAMARVNRWWKNFDEGYMQPRFGGPSSRNASSANLAAAAVGSNPSAAGVETSNKSFSVPVSRPGG